MHKRGIVAAVILLSTLASVRPAGAAGGPPYKVPAATSGTTSSCDVPIAMSDGVRLFADLVSPDKPARRPTILTVTGYNKGPGQYGDCRASDGLFATHGYNRLVVDDRGTGNSEGSWDSWGERMQQDYKELLDWIVKQPWSDGTVGTTGGSYLGITSFLVAQTGHPSVKAIWADVPMADAYRDVTNHGGNVNTTFIPLWLLLVAGLGAPPPSWTFADPGPALVAEATHLAGTATFQGRSVTDFALGGELAYDGPVYKLRSPETKAGSLKVPVAWTGGWFDLFQRGEMRLYNALSGLGPDKKKLFMSPTYHTSGNSHWDELGFGSKSAVTLAWFDHWLKGAENGIERIPSINLWTMGAEKWTRPAAWPAPSTQWTRYHLGGGPSDSAQSLNDGRLATAPAAPGSDALPTLPLVALCSRMPTQWSAGLLLGGSDCETDNRQAERLALTYSTDVLTQDAEITGPILATLWGTLSRPDANLTVILTDVQPDGRSTQVTGGWLNASHRAVDATRAVRVGAETVIPWHPYTKAAQSAVPAGTPQKYEVEVFPTSHVFKAGHRVRLTITAGDAHALSTLPGVLDKVGGVFTVLRDASHPSSVLLPVIRPTAVAGKSLVRADEPPAPVLAVTGGGTALGAFAAVGFALALLARRSARVSSRR